MPKNDEDFIVTIPEGATLPGLESILKRLGYRLRFNTRGRCIDFKIRNAKWKTFEESHKAILLLQIERRFRKTDKKIITFTDAKLYQYVRSIAQEQEVDPFLEYLKALPKVNIPKLTEVEKLFSKLFGYDEFGDEFARQKLLLPFLTAVWRAFRPGYKVDEIAVLKGAQGIGKDALFRAIVPEPDFTTQNFSFATNDKEKVYHMLGRVFCLASEMAGLTRDVEIQSLKRYITDSNDDFRLLYERTVTKLPRRYVVVCTTNDELCLPEDVTGSRRWAMIDLPHGYHREIESECERVRDRLWAEVVAMYHAGIKPGVAREHRPKQEAENLQYTKAETILIEAIDNACERGDIHVGEIYKLGDIARLISLTDNEGRYTRLPKRDEYRLIRTLPRCGFVSAQKRRKSGGNAIKGWLIEPDSERGTALLEFREAEERVGTGDGSDGTQPEGKMI